MKYIILFASLFFTLISCEPNKQYSYYGEQIEIENSVAIANLESEMNGRDSANVKLEGVIVETCEKKGCWMTAKMNDGSDMRVTFKDYGFFVPKDGVEGKTFIAQGVAKKTITDVETLKHFAEDAGKSPEEIASITEPKEEITFIATGVAIEDSQE